MSDLEAAVTALMSWCGVAAAGWGMLAYRRYRRQPVLRFEPRLEPPWGVLDLLVVLCILFGPQLAVAKVFEPVMTPGTPQQQLLKELLRWNLLVSVISLFGAVAYLENRPGGGLAHVGLRLRRIDYQLGLGIACFVMIGPLVYGLQFILVTLLDIPSEHPLIELVKKDATAFRMSAFTAVVVAPITEELLFRGVLQGWLERLTLFQAEPDSFLFGFRPDPDDDDDLSLDYPDGNHPTSWMPIVVSSLVFAGLHFSHGPDPIPLFVLALALGYLYQRTHWLLPCIVVHMCLNGMTMLMLWSSLQAPSG